MTTAEQVLRRARSQLGVAEMPAGSNQVLYSDWYGVKGPWCAMFVSWCTFEEGLPLAASTSKGFAYTPAGAQWFQRRGAWTTDRPEPGHIVFYDFPGDDIRRISHVGIVESVENDGTIVAIEGNTDDRGGRTGGQVMRRRRRSGIVGFGVPDYDPTSVGPIAPPLEGELRLGSLGKDVRILQARLVQLGAGLAVDGDFGPLTDKAVREFQVGRGLKVDGVVGPETWKALWGTAN